MFSNIITLVSVVVSTILLCQDCSGTPINARPAYLTPIYTTNALDGGKTYSFGYDTRGQPGAQLFRKESKNAAGIVTGTYGYVDPNGHLRQVDYSAGPQGLFDGPFLKIADGNSQGFRATGDVGVDYETARAAAQIAKLAPRPPTVQLSPISHPKSGYTLLYPQGHYPVKSVQTVPYLGIGRPVYYYVYP